MSTLERASSLTAVRTSDVARILRDWLDRGDGKDEERTVAVLARRSGVAERKIRLILAERAHETVSDWIFDRLTHAIGRWDLFVLTERVEDGRARANRERARKKVSCAPLERAA